MSNEKTPKERKIRRKRRIVKQSFAEGTVTKEAAEEAVKKVREKVASDRGRLVEAIAKSQDDRSVKKSRRKSGQKFKQGEWVFDKSDGFHGIVTFVDTDDGGNRVYRVTSPAPHAINAQERLITEENIGTHKPKEFRYKD